MYPGVLYCSAGVKEAGVQVWCRSSCQSSQNSAAIWVLLYEPLPLVLRIVWLSPNFGLQAQALDSKAWAFAQSWLCVIFKSFTVGYIQWSFTYFGTKGVMFSATYKFFFVQWLLKLQPINFFVSDRTPSSKSFFATEWKNQFTGNSLSSIWQETNEELIRPQPTDRLVSRSLLVQKSMFFFKSER